MNRRIVDSTVGVHLTDGIRREQELCVEALDSGEYDTMSDAEWVALCEKLSRSVDKEKSAEKKAGEDAEAKKAAL